VSASTARRPPRATLYPYTTLFRSRRRRIRQSAERVRRVRGTDHQHQIAVGRHLLHRGLAVRRGVADVVRLRADDLRVSRLQRRDDVGGIVDRQGRLREVGERRTGWERSEEHTLNSSHVKISYAVFCLKKKKRQERSDL